MTVCAATITELEAMGPGLMRVRLAPSDASFSFVAGQWIDLGVDIDGQQVVAGYSPASSPSQREFFDLGVRLGRTNRVSQWFHHEADVGDQVTVSGGHGTCVYEPADGVVADRKDAHGDEADDGSHSEEVFPEEPFCQDGNHGSMRSPIK